MIDKWEVYDSSMLYPENSDPIPYFIFSKRSENVEQVKMVLCIDAPARVPDLQTIRELADLEYSQITGMWAGQLVDAIDGGRLTFDLVFANELIDQRKRVASNIAEEKTQVKCDALWESGDTQSRGKCQSDAVYNVLPQHTGRSGVFVCASHLDTAIEKYSGNAYAFDMKTRQMVYPKITAK